VRGSLRCGISARLRTGLGQTQTKIIRVLCLLPTAADIGPREHPLVKPSNSA
jgi:hypothetical protein